MFHPRSLFILLFAGCTANDDIHAPAISGVNPPQAVKGTSIAISGNYFCQQPEPHGEEDVDPLACDHMGTVQFNSSPVNPLEYTDTSITVEVPGLSPGLVDVRVNVSGRTSNAVELRIDP